MIKRISDSRYEIEMENERPFGMGVFIDMALVNNCVGLCILVTSSTVRKILKFPVYLYAKMRGKDYFQPESVN